MCTTFWADFSFFVIILLVVAFLWLWHRLKVSLLIAFPQIRWNQPHIYNKHSIVVHLNQTTDFSAERVLSHTRFSSSFSMQIICLQMSERVQKNSNNKKRHHSFFFDSLFCDLVFNFSALFAVVCCVIILLCTCTHLKWSISELNNTIPFHTYSTIKMPVLLYWNKTKCCLWNAQCVRNTHQVWLVMLIMCKMNQIPLFCLLFDYKPFPKCNDAFWSIWNCLSPFLGWVGLDNQLNQK